MGRERLFRGGREGRDRSFDWYALAKERDISLEQARVLYEEALRRRARESQGPHRNAEAIYLELLEEARQEAGRPSPGKATRTMRLAAERAGKKQPRSHISPLTGQPITPGKRTLTSYLEPPARERRQAKQERERLEAIAESFRALGVAVPADLQSALASVQHAQSPGAEPVDSDALPTAAPSVRAPSRPETAAHRRLQANLLAAHGHFEELDALDEWPPPSEWQSTLERQSREQITNAWKGYADDGQPETSVGHAWWPIEDMLFRAQMAGEGDDLRPPMAVARRSAESWDVVGPIQAAGLQGPPEEPVRLPEPNGGAELPEDVRAKMETAFGVDFTPVRIHEGPHVEAIGALAYTKGTNIHFAPGQYQPTSQRGQELLGHELTHVVQQSRGHVAATGSAKGVPLNDDPALEKEADELGARAARGEKGAPGGAVAAGGGHTAQRKADPVGEVANAVESSGEEMLSAIGDAATPTAQARMRGAPIQARVASGPIQRQKQNTYVPHTIHVDVPMTQEQFRVKAMIQVFGKMIDKVEWKNSKNSYVPENSPYTLNVDVDLLRLHRGQASKSKGIDVGEGGTVAGRGGTREEAPLGAALG